MNTQHTPGPWEWDESGYVLRPVTPTRYSVICELESRGRVTRCETKADIDAMEAEGDANRRVMAAAPILLEHLQHAVRFFDQLTKVDADRYRAAIAKATAINSTGQYYAKQADGHMMLCNADGTRSIFDDVDE